MKPSSTLPRRSWLCAVGTLGLALTLGCRRYPKVQSEDSLKFVQQLYTACNTRSTTRLEACKQDLEKLVADKLLGSAEESAFRQILEAAERGEWELAESQSLQFARDQIR